MFSLFPSLLSFQSFAPLLLRVTLGAVFLLWAYNIFKKRETGKRRALGILDAVVGISLVVGFLTQLSALVCAIMLGFRLFKKIQSKTFLTDGINYYLILFVISICLIFTGAGFIAFDLPL